ncbi:MAG: hypothetical protein IT262_08325 [Saprospiraceae bacterium]|nr:hypothetical protein [Saprospiraceae bacterium]
MQARKISPDSQSECKRDKPIITRVDTVIASPFRIFFLARLKRMEHHHPHTKPIPAAPK